MITKSDTARVTALLKQFGCNFREAEIYLKLYTLGPTTIQDLAHKLKSNRVTVHSAADQLIEKGFVYESRRGKRRLVVAEDPSALHRQLERQQGELDLVRTNVDYVEKILERVKAPDIGRPTIKFYEEVDGLKRMLEETLETKGEILVFSNVQRLANLLVPDYLENYFMRRAKKGIHTRLIFPPCSFAERVNKRAKEYKIQIRLLPESYKWKSGIFAWDTSLSLLSYTEEKVTCTIIENVDIAHLYRNIVFDLCWQMGKPMEAKH